MKKILMSVIVVAALTATVAPAAADESNGKPELLTEQTAAVVAGDTVWLALNWTAEKGSLADFAVQLRKEPRGGVVVTYPTNTATYTGLMNGHQLDEGEIDFTAIRVYVPASYDGGDVKLEFEVTYSTGGRAHRNNVKVEVPVVRYTDGEHLVQHAAAATVNAGEASWVAIDFTGLAPVIEGVRVSIDGPLDIAYPGDGAFTSLHGDDRLEDGETDTARFLVDATDAAPGTHELTTRVEYDFAGRRHSRSGTVTVTVA